MRKIRIAQIGSGHDHATAVFRCLERRTDLFEVAGYSIPEEEKALYPERLDKFGTFPELSPEEILADQSIEAVTVETQELSACRYSILALQAGKHVHMDKPGGADPEEFRRMIDLVKEKNRAFSTGYMYRFNPAVIELLERIKQGELGEILSVEAQMSCYHPPEKRQWLKDFPGGMMFFLGCHLVDLVLRIQGKPRRILPMNKCGGADGVTAEDCGFAVLEYENGVSFVKTCACERGGFERRQLVVTGTKGTVEIKPLEDVHYAEGQYTFQKECFSEAWSPLRPQKEFGPFRRYDAMLERFAATVRGEAESLVSPDYEWELYQAVLKACGKEGENDESNCSAKG